jgi:radical SAM superfamily enzyme YgiQ (UPF0313 family)
MIMGKIKKVILTQPNYSIAGKRTWGGFYPYTLGLLNACIKDYYNTEIFDPNFDNLLEEDIYNYFRKSKADIVAVTSCSTEYVKENNIYINIIKKALPGSIIISGGIIPTVLIDMAMGNRNINYWIRGEGEITFLQLLNNINSGGRIEDIPGLCYYLNNKKIISKDAPLVENLDKIPFPNYGNLDISKYGYRKQKFSVGFLAQKYPYTVTLTSRGCPYKCIFCSGSRIGGSKVRMRSASNILKEVDILYKQGYKEIIILDDHFLFSRERAIEFMKGLIERNYDLTWKCLNLTVWLLDEELLDLMRKSGCYQMTVSIESGNQYVVKRVIGKPIDLDKAKSIIKMAKDKGFEIMANFVIGFPDETWEQIRESLRYAEEINVDLVNIHIATPLPNTKLTDICIEKNLISKQDIDNLKNVGYTKATISTDEFTALELQILRAFEWDRINFKTQERKEKIAVMEGITIDELEEWRKETRKRLGVDVLSKRAA